MDSLYKLLVLALKEVRVTFRDSGALLLMLVAPFVLTLAVVGAFGTGGDVQMAAVPVLLYNQDSQGMGNALVETFQSPELASLVVPQVITDSAAGRLAVQKETAAALVSVPPTLTQQLMASNPGGTVPMTVEIYSDPLRSIGTLVVSSIASQFLDRASMASGGTRILLGELVKRGVAKGGAEEAATLGAELQAGLAISSDTLIGVEVRSTTGREFNWLNYFAPSLAILFLMFAATGGGRTLIAEKQEGTLPRLLVSPTPAWVILMGKMTGSVFTGLFQVSALWIATGVVGAYWGPVALVIPCVVLLVVCATGLGALIASWARTTTDANMISAVVVLLSSALAGNFYPRSTLPQWIQWASLISPNGWGLELFTRLQGGAGWLEIAPLLGGLLVLTVIYYGIAIWGFRRQFV